MPAVNNQKSPTAAYFDELSLSGPTGAGEARRIHIPNLGNWSRPLSPQFGEADYPGLASAGASKRQGITCARQIGPTTEGFSQVNLGSETLAVYK